MKRMENLQSDIERSFYGTKDTIFENISIEGPLDGESSFKECQNIVVSNSFFDLRYPFWHNHQVSISNVKMTTNCRAALWYDQGVDIDNCVFNGIKVLRECQNIAVRRTSIYSPEPFWFCHHIKINDSTLEGEYAFLESSDIEIDNLTFKGKYSFQYVKNLVINNSFLDTKDAFWHSENVVITNSTIKGEYLGWYSKNLKFVNCKIIGTQPICYANDIIFEDCTMEEADFAFEYSTINAIIKNDIISIKNPYKGVIKAHRIGEIIIDENAKKDSKVEIITEIK